jgi:polyhydroxyalkanoate synthesis regulator phasin
MTIQTITHLDTLKIASSSQTVIEMIEKITTDGSLNEVYEYLYSDLFVVFNRIYNNGTALDGSINNTLRDEINHDFDRMHYHISVAEGLAAGIITAPGVGPEIDNATDWSNKAQSNIKKLNDNASGIIKNDEARRYVEGLQNATNDKALNVDELIKRLFWTIIVNLNSSNVTKEDFEGKVAEIHLDLLKLKNAGWKGYFELEGLKINLDKPGENDDLDKVQKTLATVGEIVGVLGLGVMVYNWKVSGLKPGRFLKAAFQKLTASTPAEAAEMTATGEAIEAEVVEISAMEAFADVLGVVGLILAVIGGIIEAVELDKELDKINSAKKDFNSNYKKLVNNVESVVRASEGIRKHS